jgi:hypothetical protein
MNVAMALLLTAGLAMARDANKDGNMSGSVKRDAGKVWIDGVDKYQVMCPLYESVRIVLAARGEKHTPAYLQGISGSAFRIGGICPCAPTCANWKRTEDVIKLLGYELEYLKLGGKKGDDLAAATKQIVQRVRQEIDAGRAVLLWEAFTTAEWDVVFGYDAAKGQLLGRGSHIGNDKPYTTAAENRMAGGKACPPVGAILIGRKTGKFDARAAETASLQEAMRHARWQPQAAPKPNAKDWGMYYGLACWDRWIADFRKEPKRAGNGSQYCYNIVRSTHRAAGGFLREIAPKYANGCELLTQAAACFEKEAGILDGGQDLLCWSAPKDLTAEHCRKAADVLQKARDQYAAGIELVAKALDAEGVK